VLTVRPWLYAIARNACIDRIRTRKRTEPLDALADELVAGEQGADVTFEQRAELRALLGDMGGLSEAQRSAIVLREVVGLDYGEIARVLESSEERVSWLVADARSSLHQLRDARNLSCASVRPRFLSRSRDRVARAHLATCADCQAYERKRIGARIHSGCFVPLAAVWGLLRDAASRFAAFAGGGDAPASVLKSAAAAAAAVAVAGGAVSTTGPHGHDTAPPPAPAHAVASTTTHAARPIVLRSAPRRAGALRPSHARSASPVSAKVVAPVRGSEGGVTAHVPAVPALESAPASAPSTAAPASAPAAPTAAQPVAHAVEQVRTTVQRTVDAVQQTLTAAAAPVQPVVDAVHRTLDGLLTPAR
jgi:hypothetical protein